MFFNNFVVDYRIISQTHLAKFLLFSTFFCFASSSESMDELLDKSETHSFQFKIEIDIFHMIETLL